ncbi:hypothetical protein N9X81_00045 [Schleiferiaceae bacterium]|nr:hypothetical protein [Schleiferiaceae bacterium]
MTKNVFLLAFTILFAGAVQAQEVRITGHQVVAADSTWTVPAGTTVLFGPNASVEVQGGLDFQGTSDNPIRITSGDLANGTGLGFLINGQSNANINLSAVIITDLQTPFRFDPYWYRPQAAFTNISFYNNNQEYQRSTPIFSVATPFLRLEQPANFTLSGLYFANNYGGVFIDGVGQNGSNLNIDGLAFEYNDGFSEYNTPLHLELTGVANNYTFNNLLFNQNENYGLSVGGLDGTLTAGKIYLNPRETGTNILDKNANYRLPAVEAERLSLADNPEAPGFYTQTLYLDHEPGTVIVQRATGATQAPDILLDAEGARVDFTATETDRGLELSYELGLPALASLAQGTLAWIEPLSPEELPTPVYDFTEPSMGSGFTDILDDMGVTDWANTKMDQLLHPKNKPGFEESWEAGGTFGGTLYDSRDLKMLRFSTSDIMSLIPNVGMLWPGGAIGFTGGAYVKHNTNSFVSYKASVNALNVNSGKTRSFPYRFTSAPAQNRTIDQRGNSRTYNHTFSTSVQTLEFEAIRHLRSNQVQEGKSAKWVPSLTAGIGALHFTPYALQNVRTTDEDYKYYLFTTRDIHRNLRRAGTAGQNNIDGMSRYNSFALMASTGFSLSYKNPSWSLTGQIKGNITTTDYLDDFGRGTYFGGDYDSWLASIPQYTYTDPLSGDERSFSSGRLASASRYGGSRAQNYMPDGFWQVQLSFSKDIAGDPLKNYYEPYILTNLDKVSGWMEKRKGQKLLDETWEWGTWFGTSIYDGRDLKYLQIANTIPVPTNIEFSEGLYVQKNTHSRFSWNMGIHAANLGYARRSGSPYIVTLPGAQIPSYNPTLDTTVNISSAAANFYTRTSSIESNVLYHLRDYNLPEGKKFWLVPSFGFGLGIMNYTPYREVRGLNVGDPRFLSWKRSRTHYVDLREIGSEGQNILPNGRAYGRWAGLYNASFQLSLHTKKWIYKGEIKSNMTTTDYLDDFGRGAWYGGNYEAWGEALDVSYIDVNTGQDVPLTPQQISRVPEEANLFTPRATNNMMDGYMQFHIGIARRF